jgi:hypothetical protein
VCKRCSTALSFVPEEVAQEIYETRERKNARRQGFVKTLPVLVPMLLAVIGFSGFHLVKAVAREVGPIEGPESPKGFKVLAMETLTSRPLRFDPCTKQHYVINPNGAPDGGIKDVHGAVRRIEEASGIDFVYDGLSHEPGHWDRALVDEQRYGKRWSPVLVTWVPYDLIFFPDDWTYAAAQPLWTRNSEDQLVTVSGTILLNGSRTQRSGFDTGWTWGHVLMHEWGHVLGLGHVSDPQQVMHKWHKPDDGKWGDGDLIGLQAMGRKAGCQTQPKVEDYDPAEAE